MTFQAQPGGHCGTGNAVLSGAGLGDDAGLAHGLRQQCLADRIIYFVGAGVVQIFTLQIDFGTGTGLG